MARPWINLIAGAWAFLAGFWLLHPFNFFAIGLIIAVFGFWTYRKEWQGIVNGILGIWLIISALVPALMTSGNLWVTGLIVMGLAAWRLFDLQKRRPLPG